MISSLAINRCRIMNRRRRKSSLYSDEVRIGAVVDYIATNLKVVSICSKWGLRDHSTLSQWIRETGHFKLRKRRTIRKKYETRYLEAA